MDEVFSKTSEPILTNKIYVVVTKNNTFRKKFGFFWIKKRGKKCFQILNFFFEVMFQKYICNFCPKTNLEMFALTYIFVRFFVVVRHGEK